MGRIVDTICERLREDLRFDAGLFCDDSERVAFLKWSLEHVLTARERRLLLLYVHFGSCRKVAAKAGITHNTVAYHIGRIRRKLLEEYEKHKK